CAPPRGPEECRRVEQAVHPAGSLAEEGRLLLQVHVYAPVEDGSIAGGRGLVERWRQVHRHHQRVMTLSAQLGHQGVVAETGAAVEAAGARCQLDDAHSLRRLTLHLTAVTEDWP